MEAVLNHAHATKLLQSFVHVWRFNLVDPASSHMLVSKIKPCVSQYKLLHGDKEEGRAGNRFLEVKGPPGQEQGAALDCKY